MQVFFDVLRIRRRIDESIWKYIPDLWNISAIDLVRQIPMIYDNKSWEPIHTSSDAAISGGANIMFSTFEETVMVTDLKTGKKLQSISGGHSSIVSALCFYIDVGQGRMQLAVGSGDCRIKLRDLSTHLLVGSFEVTNILLVNKMLGLRMKQQIVGSYDEIIDILLLNLISAMDLPSHLAIATNSPLVRVLSLGKEENHCSLSPGYSDIVLCLAKSKDCNVFVSGSKDRRARIWNFLELVKDVEDGKLPRPGLWKCVASLMIAIVVQFCYLPLPLKIKLLRFGMTLKIHDKDISSINFSSDCKLFAKDLSS
ncbi:WD40-repeat-containing domain protein [Phakopsora pachyrhizi]|uniref:WD40-repeat-containing domain protein n=1 Tax=Phakopsora pachyrhizi TaxID=170000 RepID=A0AAV0BFI6_PHAPC|nr:WD40-repeat-containing domain protein [Phakopsora pachyrhizi]